MKMSTLMSAVFVSLFMLSGCAQTTCDHFEKSIAGLKSKVGTCSAGFQVSGFSSCETSLSDGSCSVSDFENIDKQLDCVDKVGTCVAGQEREWYDTVGMCSTHLDKVSAACRAAMQKQ